MSEPAQRKKLYYQIIPRIGEPVWGQDVLAFQSHDRTENGVTIKGQSYWLQPNGSRQYVVPAEHPQYEACKTAMRLKMESENHVGQIPRIVGPFESSDEAIKAMHEKREKEPKELLAVERAKAAKVEDENNALKQRIKELESKFNK